MAPIITVVTVCYNSERTIQRTIESVIKQDLSDIEYLIVDGASTDKTLGIIEDNRDRFGDTLRIISEPDKGWYDAMNKGIHNAKGAFIVFLNSDDYFDDGAIGKVINEIQKNGIGADSIVYGDSTNIYRNSKGEELFRRINAPDHISQNNRVLRDGMCGIRHQSMFTGRDVFKRVGELDLKYRLHADWDFLVKCIKQGVPMYHISENLTFYSMYGASTKPNCGERHLLRKDNELYNVIDWNYIRDRWGTKAIIKKIIGERKWNDLLFDVHKIRKGKGI